MGGLLISVLVLAAAPAFAAPDALIVKVRHPGTWGWSLSTRALKRIDAEQNGYYVVRTADPTAAANELKKNHEVLSVSPDYELSDPGAVTPDDPSLEKQWYLDAIAVPAAWELATGKGTWVADVESGWDIQHPDLARQFDLAKSFDYDPDTQAKHKISDNVREHGTPVAGLIAMEANNGRYGTGVAFDTRLIGSQSDTTPKAFGQEKLWTVGAARAILGSIEQRASVILIEKQVPSLFSSVERVPIIYDAIKAATDAGIPVIVPAGNFNRELKEEAELADSGAIFVGAVNRKLEKWDLSNHGTRVDISAPGDALYTLQEFDGETQTFGGTSGASALVAGAVALIREANPRLTPKEIRQILRQTGKAVDKFPPLLQAQPAVMRALNRG